MILMDCNNAVLGSFLYMVKNVLNIIWVVGPILAIISLIINVSMLMKDPEDKKVPKKIKNSLIALVILFMIPTVINATMSIIGEKTEISSCWKNAKKTNLSSTYIDPDPSKKKPIIVDPKGYEPGVKKSTTEGGTAAYNPNGELAERIASAAEYYAWPEGTPKSKYSRFEGGGSTPQFMADYRKIWPNFANSSDKSVAAGTCCCHFARTCVVKALGKKFTFTLLPSNSSEDGPTQSKMANLGFTRIAFDGKKSSLRRGDVLYYRNKSSGGHVWIYLGNNRAAEGSHGNGYGGRITKVGNSFDIGGKEVYYIFRAVK